MAFTGYGSSKSERSFVSIENTLLRTPLEVAADPILKSIERAGDWLAPATEAVAEGAVKLVRVRSSIISRA